MHFKLIDNVDKEALLEWPAWGQYDEPDDIESLVGLGYDRELVRSRIEATGWSDRYWFPIPEGAPPGMFRYEQRRAYFHNSKGRRFAGYVMDEGHAIGLFGKSREWLINVGLLSLFDAEKAGACADLGLESGEDLLPLFYEVHGQGEAHIFPADESTGQEENPSSPHLPNKV